MSKRDDILRLLGVDSLADNKPTEERANGAHGREGIGSDTILMPLPGRSFERKQGCWNCVSFDNGQRASDAWEADMLARSQGLIETGLRNGHSLPVVQREAQQDILTQYRLFAPPRTGLCNSMTSKSGGKYTMNTFLAECWTGRPGTRHEKLDMVPGELKDRLGDFDAKPIISEPEESIPEITTEKSEIHE